MFTWIVLSSALLWLIILILPWKPWSTEEQLDSCSHASERSLSNVTVIIPARNEEHYIQKTIEAVKNQGKGIKIVIVDDCSQDQTYLLAKKSIIKSDIIIKGKPRPPDWSGKLWALEQGLAKVKTEFTLLLDADILLKPFIVSTALDFMETNQIDFLSLMAKLKMQNLVERLFMPAFIYFFKLLYPFSISNKPNTFIAAGAGGFILIKTDFLQMVHAFQSLKNALIDDCALASKIKKTGAKTWIGLTHSVISMRSYKKIREIWQMVERTAFTQLHYSAILLSITTFIMAIAFIVPIAGLLSLDLKIMILCIAAISFMCITYLPVLKFYSQKAIFAPLLSLVAICYVAMTWSSALKYWKGQGTYWKGRKYR